MAQIAETTQLLTLGNNRPGRLLTGFRAFVVHETGNENPRADAAMHRRYWMPGGDGRMISSVHFVADANTSIQLLPTNEIGWHIGDGANQPATDDSFFTVAGEICVNSRDGFPAACRRMAGIVARVLIEKSKAPIDGVTIRKHGSYPATTHRSCPLHLNKGDWGVTWAQFVGMVTDEYHRLTQEQPVAIDIWAVRWGSRFAYNSGFGIETEWRTQWTKGRRLGEAITNEALYPGGGVYRVFQYGIIVYTDHATTYGGIPA